MLKFNPSTPIKLYVKKTEYVSGKGNVTTWNQIITNGYSVFYCEWKGAFGDRAMAAEGMGVKDWATIRTHYNPTIYEQLKTVSVVVVKNADETAFVNGEPVENNMNVYELWGGVDNVLEQNQFLEFKVRRYEQW